jgi:N-acetyl-anhydromuramyl-L-alanine amidase AmpD
MRKLTALFTVFALTVATFTVSAAATVLTENSQQREGEITHIVLHFASNVTENPADPFNIDEIYSTFSRYDASAHYFIDRDGTVHSAVAEERAAWHAGRGQLPDFPDYENRLNHHSIGIELLAIGSYNDMEQYLTRGEYDALNPDFIGFTDSQYNALNKLIDDILSRNKSIVADRSHIIGHSEYSTGDKSDPGELFDWSRIDALNPKG